MLCQYRGEFVMSVSRSFAVVAALRPARTQRGVSSSLAQHCSQDCWSKGETLFATLPHECGPVRSSTVEVVSGANAVAVGSEISVSDSGELTLMPKQDSVWMLRLEGVVIPMRPSDWGWSFVSKLVVALGLYASGGVLLARSRGSALVLRSHPHWGLWMQLRSLCADGVACGRAKVSGRTAPARGGPQQALWHADAQGGQSQSRTREKQHKGKLPKTHPTGVS